MKKKLKEYITLSIIITMLAFLSFSFVKAEINPFNWEMEYRAFLVTTTLLGAVPLACAMKIFIENN